MFSKREIFIRRYVYTHATVAVPPPAIIVLHSFLSPVMTYGERRWLARLLNLAMRKHNVATGIMILFSLTHPLRNHRQTLLLFFFQFLRATVPRPITRTAHACSGNISIRVDAMSVRAMIWFTYYRLIKIIALLNWKLSWFERKTIPIYVYSENIINRNCPY